LPGKIFSILKRGQSYNNKAGIYRQGGIFMRQNNNNGTVQEMISMEEYLERRQERRRTEITKDPVKGRRAAEWSAAMELVQLYV
jgi:hypothetical protein